MHYRKRLTEEDRKKVVELYKGGLYCDEIGEQMGINVSTAWTIVEQQIKAGLIEKHPRKEPKRKSQGCGPTQRSWNREKIPMIQAEPEQPAGVTVRCTVKISQTCVYGRESKQTNGPLCNYILCEGKMRGCDPWACDKYSRVTRTNKRRVCIR